MAPLPDKKRDEEEMQRMRSQEVALQQQPVIYYQKKKAGPIMLFFCYLLTLLGLGLLTAAYIYVFRKLSRHHAVMMIIGTVLVYLVAWLGFEEAIVDLWTQVMG